MEVTLLIISLPQRIHKSSYIFRKAELAQIAKIAENNDLYVISDEIYDKIVFTEFTYFSEFKNLRGRLIVANGFSKTYAMTGWCIGYLLGSEKIISKVSLIHQHTAACAVAASQYAALAALQGSQDMVDNMVETYIRSEEISW